MLSWRPLWPSPIPIVPHELQLPQWRKHAPDADILTLDWLLDQSSLTQRLTQLSAEFFSVTLWRQGWQTLRIDECAALDLPDDTLGWVREVYLSGCGQPWVFARSVAGQVALQAHALGLETLGKRSLGELLFSDPAFTRQAIETCRYPAAWLPPLHSQNKLWARRSRFDRDGLSVLVAEVFLPDLWRAAHSFQENH